MKTLPLSLLPVLFLLGLASCTTPPVCVTQTHVATTNVGSPRAIYIRPFALGPFDLCSPSGDRVLRASLAPGEFANDLQEELAKIAPARVLQANEAAPLGWVVDGEFECIESGYAPPRWRPWGGSDCGPLALPSQVLLHVRIREACGGALLYAFDVKAYSNGDHFGSATKPGLGYPLPFDFRNAAEQIAMAITPDPFRYGLRTSPTLRY